MIYAVILALFAATVMLSCLRISGDADDHAQIMHDSKNEKY